MRIEPACEHFGAFVSDVDLRQLSDDDTAAIEAAWAEHGVLFFRDQPLSPDEHIAFAERFAPIDVNKFFRPVDGHPKIAQVLKEPDQIANIGGGWHTDHSYDQIPARGSILLAQEVPPTGGDTLFMSVAAAYDALDDDLKQRLVDLEADHSNEHVFGAGTKQMADAGERMSNSDQTGNARHPIVVAHPTTGRKLLYVNAAFTISIVGMSRDESDALLGQLYEHMVQPEFSYRYRWEAGSIAMWDNRSTWHWALNDYPGHRRLMHRITVQGEPLTAAA